MDEVYSWIKNIVIYMILNTIVMNLLGNKSYKKYVSVVSGMILVLIVISPIIKLMKLDESLDYYLQSNDYSVEASEFKNDLSRVEEEQRDLIFKEYENKIKQGAQQILLSEGIALKSFHITIDQDINSSTFGEITRMDITAVQEDGQEEQSIGRLKIDEIDIPEIAAGDGEESPEQTVPSPLEIEIKKRLADFYNLEQGNINISIQGG